MITAAVTAQFRHTPEQVWKVVTDNKHFSWRRGLSDLKVSVDGMQFTEYTGNNFPTHLTVTKKQPPSRYEFDMENQNLQGHWTGVFSFSGSGTQFTMTEEIEVPNPLMRLLAKSYLKRQQAAYLSDLRSALGE